MNNKLLEKAKTIINNMSKEELILLLMKHGVKFSEIQDLEHKSRGRVNPPSPESPQD